MAKNIQRLPSCIEINLNDKELKIIVEKAKDWALMHGAGMRSKIKFSQDSLIVAPFTLLPSTFPRSEFESAVNIQTVLNKLIHRVAHNYSFLKQTLENTIQVDDFTKKLFEIYEIVRKEGEAQKISLGLLRSDYLLDNLNIKQVELNTIASSFAGIAQHITSYNRFVLTELGHQDKLEHLPDNNCLTGLCEGILEAYKLFNKPKSVILFVVEDVTYNICDQRFHEFEIRKLSPNVQIIRRTLSEIGKTGKLTEDKHLVIDDLTVAVVYFRAGYAPDQYFTQLEWDARLTMERSTAIKCPSIHYHLAGTKKVQQALAKKGILEQFLDKAEITSVQKIFTGLWSLDLDEGGNTAIEMACSNPMKYVLKPQREGGGNNIYGENIPEALLAMKNSKERSAWILMEKIEPPLQKNFIIRADNPVVSADVVSELGIYGVVIGDEKHIIVNRQVGHMLRTKLSTSNEGGVASGSGALDSPYLI